MKVEVLGRRLSSSCWVGFSRLAEIFCGCGVQCVFGTWGFVGFAMRSRHSCSSIGCCRGCRHCCEVCGDCVALVDEFLLEALWVSSPVHLLVINDVLN